MDGHDPHPGAQIAAPGEVDDLRSSCCAHEHAGPDILLDLRDYIGADAHLAQNAIELAQAVHGERSKGWYVAACTSTDEIQVRYMHLAERDRRRNVGRESVVDIRHKYIGRQVDRGPRALCRSDDVGHECIELVRPSVRFARSRAHPATQFVWPRGRDRWIVRSRTHRPVARVPSSCEIVV